jgi:hypothetical protein
MGNVDTKYNGRRGGKEPVTIRSLHREVKIYRVDNKILGRYTSKFEYIS